MQLHSPTPAHLRWRHHKERSTPFALKLIRWLALHLNREVVRPILWPIVAYFLLTAGAAVRASRQFLTRVFGRPATVAQAARHIHSFAATILDRVYLISGRHQMLDVRVYGEEIAQEYGRRGGSLLIGSHLGSFEVLRAIAVNGGSQSGVKVKMVMRRGHNEMITQLLEALNPEILQHMIDTGDDETENALKIRDALDQGCMVSLMGDRANSETEKTARCRFLGGTAEFPLGWLLLASVMQVPVLLCFGLYRGGNRYDIHFELLAERIHFARKSREAEAAVWAQRYAGRLEHYAKDAPYNWFNFYDFWHETAPELQPAPAPR